MKSNIFQPTDHHGLDVEVLIRMLKKVFHSESQINND